MPAHVLHPSTESLLRQCWGWEEPEEPALVVASALVVVVSPMAPR